MLGAFLAFFGAIFAMNGALVYEAVRTNSGLVANEPYRKGLHYNARIAADERQARLRWTGKLEVSQAGALTLALNDASGQPVTGLKMEAVLGRPATSREDIRLALVESAPGHYEAHAARMAAGAWLAGVEARSGSADDAGEPVYRMRRRLWFSP